MEEIKIGLLGCGSMGTGVAKTIEDHSELLAERAGAKLTLARVADLNIENNRGLNLPLDSFTTDVQSVVDDPDIPIIIELIGGTGIAKKLTESAFEKGKHVVTANKALLAMHGEEMFAAARDKKVFYEYEASVAGGIPILAALRNSLTANQIYSVKGIINGTSNYILSRMTDEGKDFDDILKDAQAEGYAEADPTYDIDGTDPAHKLAVLISLAFGVTVPYDDIPKQGISDITALDVSFAHELGYRIKLLAVAKRSNEHGQNIEARVEPSLIPSSHTLAGVSGAMNAVYVEGDPIGETMFYGPGAGGGPAGSAVVADVVEIARRIVGGVSTSSVYARGFANGSMVSTGVVPLSDLRGSFYLRFNAVDETGSLAAITGILGEHSISNKQVVQHDQKIGDYVPIVILTHDASGEDLEAALTRIDALDAIKEPTFRMRLEN